MKHRLREALRDLVPTVRSTLIGVLAIAIAVSGILSVRAAAGSVRDELRAERLRLATVVGAAVGITMDSMVAGIELAYGAFAPWNPDAVLTNERLVAMVEGHPGIVHATIVNGDRILAYDSHPDPRAPSNAIARSGAHLDAAFGGAVVVTSVVADAAINRDVLLVAVPIRGTDGEVAAVGVARIPVDRGIVVDALASMERSGSDDAAKDQVGVVLPEGEVLTSKGAVSREVPTWAAPVAATAGQPGLVDHEGLGGIALVAAVAPASRGWLVVVSGTKADVEPALIDQRVVLAALPSMAALLLLMAMLSVAHRRRVRILAQDAEDTKRSFLAVTGHELRTPLTVMGGMLKTMTTALGREDIKPAMLVGMVDASRRNAQLLELRIERILLVAALEAGAGATVQSREIDLTRSVTEIVETVAQTAPSHDLHLDLPEGLMVEADPKAVAQILLELLNNAVRYTPGGGQIHVEVAKKGRRAEIRVRDNGVGLPSDSSRLFEKFRQGEEVDKRVHDEGGVGLGLWIVKTLVTAMRGHVRAAPVDPGADHETGTLIVVDLPLA